MNLERWCRLRGNLLFYFKSRDQWSEPLGVIVLEQCTVKIDPSTATLPDGLYGFFLGEFVSFFFLNKNPLHVGCVKDVMATRWRNSF